MQMVWISIIAVLLAQSATIVQREEAAQWEDPAVKKVLVFPTRAKAGTRQLTAIFAEPDSQSRSCSIRMQLDFDSLAADKERIEQAHPGWTMQRLAPTEIITRAELVAQGSDGPWQTIAKLLPDPQKPNHYILNENGLRASVVMTDGSATTPRENSQSYQLFKRLQLEDPQVQLRLTIALKKGTQVNATYKVDTVKLLETLGSQPFTAAEFDKACQAAVTWESGQSATVQTELVERLTKQLKLIEPVAPDDAQASRRFVLTERARQSSKLRLSLKDSFAVTNPEAEREVVYSLKDWTGIVAQANNLRRSDQLDTKSEVLKPSDDTKAENDQKNDQPPQASLHDGWDILQGPQGSSAARGALPRRLTIDTSRDSGFRLVKYSLTNETNQPSGVQSSAPKQGGYIQFRLLASPPPVDLGKNIFPADLAWTALELRVGPDAILRKLTYHSPAHLSFFVDSKLSRQEIDALWSPVPIADSAGQLRKVNQTNQPLIRAHAIAHDYVLIEDADAVVFQALRSEFIKACQVWSIRILKSAVANKVGAFPCNSADQIDSFMEFCLDQPGLFPKLMVRPNRLEQKLALFAQLRQAWLKYDLLDSGAGQALQVVVQPSDAEVGRDETLERSLQGWSLVERYRQLEVDNNLADWTLEELYVHGYERETDQRVHFWPIGDWEKRGIQSVGIEALFTDGKSNFSKSQKFLMPIDRPYVWQFKGRYSEQLSLQWRIVTCRMKNGQIKTAKQASAWEKREPAGVFDEIVYLDDSTADSVLGSTGSES